MEKPVMQVFKAFNCSSCAVPLTIATDCTPRPNGNEACQRTCGEMICQACLTANRHHCGRVHCSTEISFVLKDLFNSGSLTLLPFLKGYILSRPISTPECSICYEEYSAYQPDLTPILLTCRHSICNRCVGKIKIIDYSAGHRLRCPLCQVMLASADCSQNQPLVQFIKELPEMTAQMENIQKNASIGIAKSYLVVDCSDCERKCPLTDNFYCNDCQVRICAKCTVLGHRTHSLTQMVEEEAKSTAKECHAIVENQIETYEILLFVLHQELHNELGDFKREILEKIHFIGEARKIEKARDKGETCKRFGQKFEEIAKEYLPNLRAFETKLRGLRAEMKSGEIDKNGIRPAAA